MAQRVVHDCDSCGKPAAPVLTVDVPVRRCMDAAGSMDTDHERVDLCVACARLALLSLLKPLGYEEGAAWVAKCKKR